MKNKIAVCAALAFFLTASAAHARWGLDFTASPTKMDTKDLDTSKATYSKWAATPPNKAEGYVDPRGVGGAASFFVEGDSRVRLGLSAGYGQMAEVFAQVHQVFASGNKNSEFRTKTTYVPVDLYLKFGSKGGGSSFVLGGGADFVTGNIAYTAINTNTSTPSSSWADKATFTQKKMIPHAQAGFEFFLFKWLSFGANANYAFSGVLDNLRGSVSRAGNGAGKTEQKLIMEKLGSNGLKVNPRSTSYVLAAGERPFQYDYSGLRVNLAMRWYFGGGKTAAVPAQNPAQVVVTDKAPQAPAQAAPAADSETLKLEREKLELEKAKLKLEQDKLDFQKQSIKKE